MKPTYDELQAGAVLVKCVTCERSFYMTTPRAMCVECREAQKDRKP